MQERTENIATPSGEMNTYIFHPDAPRPAPVILFYMDSAGVREELSDMCRRIASVGYYVVMPNLYYRMTRVLDVDVNRLKDPAYADKTEFLWKCNRHLTTSMVMDDTRAILDMIGWDERARPGPIGVVGYCMSGRYALRAASAFPDRVGTAISMYGARLITDEPDSAHRFLRDIKGAVYFGCAEKDHYAPPEMLEKLAQHLSEAGVQHTFETYPDTHHGFAFPQRRAYHKQATETHWERLFELFSSPAMDSQP